CRTASERRLIRMIRAEQTLQERAIVAGFFSLSQTTQIKTAEDPPPSFPAFSSETIVGRPATYASAMRTVTVIPDRIRFNYLAARWREEYGVSSSTHEIVMAQSYQAIIGMGERALPFIFEQLKSEAAGPHNWFWALRSITGINPVPPEARGNRRAQAQAWIDWWHGNNGYSLINGR